MITIARLFGKSPFAPLQSHMDKVANCVDILTEMFSILSGSDMQALEKLSGKLSQMEHEADITKNDIRNHLPKSLFLPIDRAQFLEILSIQDCIADKAEEIALTISLRPLDQPKTFIEALQVFNQKVVEVFISTRNIMKEIDELIESTFGGIEAQKVKSMVELTSFKEHEVHLMKIKLLKQLFIEGEHLSAPSFFHWFKLIEEMNILAGLSEKLANRIRMVLELK